jgi:hypothetical protein
LAREEDGDTTEESKAEELMLNTERVLLKFEEPALTSDSVSFWAKS